MMRRLLSLGLFLALLLSACNATPVPAPAPGDLQSMNDALDALVPGLLSAYNIPGAAVALVHEGRLYSASGYGLADVASDTKVTPETLFQVASVSKPVSAWGVMKLVETGLVDLDAPVDTYLTRWHLPPSEFDESQVTIRRLLSHSAGLSLHGYPGFEPDQTLPTLEESLSGATGGSGDVRIVAQPGEKFSYSGGGYTLLQLLVEEVSGQPFSDYMQQQVLNPLGMERSSFDILPSKGVVTASAYDASGQQLPLYNFTARAAAGLYTSASDLGRFVAAAMPTVSGDLPGRGLLSPTTVAEMLSAAVPLSGSNAAMGDSFGLGYSVENTSDEILVASHSGGNRGWRSYIGLAPQTGEGIVILTNSDGGTNVIYPVLRLWAPWAGLGQLKLVRFIDQIETAVLAAAAVLGGLLLIWILRFALSLRRSRRQLGWSGLPRLWLRALAMLVLLGVFTAWVLWGASLVLSLTPRAQWLSLAVVLWCAAGVLETVVPKKSS